jgi:hypothetical protein
LHSDEQSPQPGRGEVALPIILMRQIAVPRGGCLGAAESAAECFRAYRESVLLE